MISLEMYPTISARSFRTTELAKELARKGHEVILYTVWNSSDFDYETYAKETGITLKDLGPLDFTLKRGLHHAILRKMALYPLIKLVPLIRKALKHEKEVDYLISIAAPHPIHWGVALSKYRGFKCWTADCGDPFMKNPYGFKPPYFKWIEKKWCREADYITVPIEEAKAGYYEEFQNKIKVIPQGFNFEDLILDEYKENEIPTFAYAGNLYKNGRNITAFMEYLSKIDRQFKFIVYTKSESFFLPYVDVLGSKMELRGYTPRVDLLKQLSKVDFLLNIQNDYTVQQPSKLIDYYLVKRPILDITSSFNEKRKLNQFLDGNYDDKRLIPDISIYNIENVANSFINLYYKSQKDRSHESYK